MLYSSLQFSILFFSHWMKKKESDQRQKDLKRKIIKGKKKRKEKKRKISSSNLVISINFLVAVSCTHVIHFRPKNLFIGLYLLRLFHFKLQRPKPIRIRVPMNI